MLRVLLFLAFLPLHALADGFSPTPALAQPYAATVGSATAVIAKGPALTTAGLGSGATASAEDNPEKNDADAIETGNAPEQEPVG